MNSIENERLKVTFRYLPNEKVHHRFETIGVMSEVVLDGKDVFTEPEQREDGRVTCYGVGLCGEYVWDEVGCEALKGEWYPKFGMGLIQQNEDHKAYNMWDNSYEYKLFPTKAEFLGDRAIFTQEPMEANGYAARIVKEVVLSGNEIISTTTMENCGQKTLSLAEYQHNFVSINKELIGPNYELYVPFNTELHEMETSVSNMKTREKVDDAIKVSDQTMHWEKSMGEGLTLFHTFEQDALDTEGKSYWTLRNKKDQVSITEEFSFKPSKLVQWGIEHCVSTEVYSPIEIEPNKKYSWTRTWRFDRQRSE